jgi:hypothetical protein
MYMRTSDRVRWFFARDNARRSARKKGAPRSEVIEALEGEQATGVEPALAA